MLFIKYYQISITVGVTRAIQDILGKIGELDLFQVTSL